VEVVEKMHNEKLHNLHVSPNIIRAIKSTSVKWAGHVEHGRHGKYIQNFGRKA